MVRCTVQVVVDNASGELDKELRRWTGSITFAQQTTSSSPYSSTRFTASDEKTPVADSLVGKSNEQDVNYFYTTPSNSPGTEGLYLQHQRTDTVGRVNVNSKIERFQVELTTAREKQQQVEGERSALQEKVKAHDRIIAEQRDLITSLRAQLKRSARPSKLRDVTNSPTMLPTSPSSKPIAATEVHELEALRRQLKQQESALQAVQEEASGHRQRLAQALGDLDVAYEQINCIRDYFFGGEEDFDVSQIREEYQLLQEEVEQYEALLAQALGELEFLRSQFYRSTNTQRYLDGALFDFEEENGKQQHELQRLREALAGSQREASSKQRDLQSVQPRLMETEVQLVEVGLWYAFTLRFCVMQTLFINTSILLFKLRKRMEDSRGELVQARQQLSEQDKELQQVRQQLTNAEANLHRQRELNACNEQAQLALQQDYQRLHAEYSE